MAFSRYLNVPIPERNTKSMSLINAAVRRGVVNGSIPSTTMVLEEDRRLDQLAGQIYGSGSYWWILASASGIGWGLQVPAGTIIVVPKDLGQILSLAL